MPTLVISAPRQKAELEQKRSFERTVETGVGDEYAIPAGKVVQLYAGCKVVVLDKDQRKRAEGTLVELVPRSKANNGMQRYDVLIKDLRLVDYKSEDLGRTGVAVI